MKKTITAGILAVFTMLVIMTISQSIGNWIAVLNPIGWTVCIVITFLLWFCYDSMFDNSELRTKVKELEKQLKEKEEEEV